MVRVSAAPPLIWFASTKPVPERPVTVPPIEYVPAIANVAVTFFAGALRDVIVQSGFPAHSPAKPEKVLPLPAAPPSVRLVPASNVRVPLAVQEVAAPPNATVPPPEPANVTLTSQVLMKLALAVASEFSVNEQEAPVQALLKASKREPEATAGVSVTAVPSGSSTEQVPLVTPALDVHE